MYLTVMDYLREKHPSFVNDEGVIIPEDTRVSVHMKTIAKLVQPWVNENRLPIEYPQVKNQEEFYVWNISTEVDA